MALAGRADEQSEPLGRHPPSLESSRGQGELRLGGGGGSLLPQAGHGARERKERERAAVLSRMRKSAPYNTDQDRAVGRGASKSRSMRASSLRPLAAAPAKALKKTEQGWGGGTYSKITGTRV